MSEDVPPYGDRGPERETKIDRCPDTLTVEQAAEFLQLSVPKVRQLAARSMLPGRRIGRGVGWRFSRKQLIEFIEADNAPHADGGRARS